MPLSSLRFLSIVVLMPPLLYFVLVPYGMKRKEKRAWHVILAG